MPAPAPHNLWLGRILDGLLFVVTLAAVGIGFWKEAPDWAPLAALLAFFLLFVWRWYIAMDRQAYLKANWLDLALIVLLASPFLRLLMAFKVAGLMPAMRLGAIIRSNRKRILKLVVMSQDSFPAAMALIFGVVFMFGTMAYLLEHATNPAFSEIADGLWWAFVTLTTVGYGDIYPITAGGRIVGVFTMVFGIAIYSLMIANLTFFVEEHGRQRREEEEKVAANKLNKHQQDE